MKILIADDETTTRYILQAILTRWGYDVISTCDGEQAWDVLQDNEPPQLALLDWEMPGMNGPELCQKVKLLKHEIPVYVILLTGRDSIEDVVHGLDSGADDYIKKPFDNSELRSRVRVAERMIAVQESLVAKIAEVQEALNEVKTLQGIIPICMYCHMIRSEHQAWNRLEAYIENHSDAQFSHSICPECMEEHYTELTGEEPVSLDSASDQ